MLLYVVTEVLVKPRKTFNWRKSHTSSPSPLPLRKGRGGRGQDNSCANHTWWNMFWSREILKCAVERKPEATWLPIAEKYLSFKELTIASGFLVAKPPHSPASFPKQTLFLQQRRQLYIEQCPLSLLTAHKRLIWCQDVCDVVLCSQKGLKGTYEQLGLRSKISG
jgi:hypothetical protein